MENNQETNADQILHQQEFGRQFREARESTGMSVDEVADSLKLTVDIIKALENSQVDRLPAATFTQGYIRSYSRMLKLDEEALIKIYMSLVPEKENPLTSRSVLPTQSTSRDNNIKFITYGLIVVGLVLFVFWLQQADFSVPDSEEVSESESFEETKESDGFYQPKEAEEALPESDVILEEETTPLKEEPAPTEEQTTEAKNENVEVVEENAVEGNDVLVMSSNSESWVEVEDSNGVRLFFELMKKGGVHKLKGKAPFRVFLGNAPSISLKLNDKEPNLSGHIRSNNVAHVAIYQDASAVNVRRKKKTQDTNQLTEENHQNTVQ